MTLAALLCTGLVDASLANAAYQRSDAHWWGYKVTIIAMRGGGTASRMPAMYAPITALE